MKNFVAILSLIAVLGISVAMAIYIWIELGDVEMSANGIIAMGLGVIISLVIGVGLMKLSYHSAKIGHDETVDKFEENTKEVN